jgi:hypothetical protein
VRSPDSLESVFVIVFVSFGILDHVSTDTSTQDPLASEVFLSSL